MTLQEFRLRYRYDPTYDKLGEGGFAKVFRAQDLYRNRRVALKFYETALGDRYSVQKELDKMMQLSHPNLITYYGMEIVEVSTDDHPNAADRLQVGVMEYANGGDLDDFITAYPSMEQIAKVVREILSGLAYLHQNGIIHRDLKPQNILLSKTDSIWTAKIADFGLAKQTADSHLSSKLLGTVEYIAPEQLDPLQFGNNGRLDTNVDLWALGVILAEIFTGEPPFGSRADGLTHDQVMTNILQTDPAPKLRSISSPYREAVLWCLRKHAKERASSATAILELLEGKRQAPSLQAETPKAVHLPVATLFERVAIVVISTFFTPLAGYAYYLLAKRVNPLKGQSLWLFWWVGVVGFVVFYSLMWLLFSL